MSDWAWQKAPLLSSRGGLWVAGSVERVGIQDPRSHTTLLSPSHFRWASRGGCWETRLDITDEVDVPHRQRPLSHSVDDCCFQLLLESAPDKRSTAHAHSSSLPNAGDWLNVIPSSAVGLHIPDRDFRLCLGYWLGLRMVGEDNSSSLVWSVRGGLMVTVTIKSVVGRMGTGSTGMTPSMMYFSLQHSRLL